MAQTYRVNHQLEVKTGGGTIQLHNRWQVEGKDHCIFNLRECAIARSVIASTLFSLPGVRSSLQRDERDTGVPLITTW